MQPTLVLLALVLALLLSSPASATSARRPPPSTRTAPAQPQPVPQQQPQPQPQSQQQPQRQPLPQPPNPPPAHPSAPNHPAFGHALAAQAEALADGHAPWTKGCVAKQKCIPYSWGGGHSRIGPTYGSCPTLGRRRQRAACDSSHVYGLDCSGFARWVYALVYGRDVLGGIGTDGQLAQPGIRRISSSAAEPGDLVYFPGHVGIFVGTLHRIRRMVDEPHPGAWAREQPILPELGSPNYARYVPPQPSLTPRHAPARASPA